MSKHRGFALTLNYFTEQDVEELRMACKSCDYYIFGFEGIDEQSKYHPHIHAYLHYKNPRSFNGVLKEFSKQHHIENVKSSEAYIEYCKGYLDGKLKEEVVGENFYVTEGLPPSNGKNKTPQLVLDAIREGKTKEQLAELFPMFMIMHGHKVKSYLEQQKPTPKTIFNVYQPIHDAITEIHEKLDLTGKQVAVVTELSQLSVYPNYDVVIWLCDFCDRIQLMWPRGSPISYKFGYEWKEVKCERLIIVTETPKLYSNYKNI